jgi:serine/threonine protein kinase
MACVFKALDTRLKVEKAIKIPNHMCLTNKKIRDRFETEATTMAMLHHKNIVIVHDIADELYADPNGFVSINLVYMVMEMLPGGSLQDRIEDHGLLHPQQAIEAAIAMASGLGFAHENNVVHRDVKLDNVLIGSNNELKVTDFGIAQIDGGSGMTQTGATMGTLAFMAPEQKLSSRRATSLSDLYSVGASLFVMLTNQNPSELYATDIQERAFEHLPEAAADVLRKCCHLEPAQRYQSADELIVALEELRAAYGPLPEDATPFYVPRTEVVETPDDIAKRHRKVNTMWTTLLGIDPDELSTPMPHPKVVTPRQNTNETALDFDIFGDADDNSTAMDLLTMEEPLAQSPEDQASVISPSHTIHADARDATVLPSPSDQADSSEKKSSSGLLIAAATLLLGIGAWVGLGGQNEPKDNSTVPKASIEQPKTVTPQIVKPKELPPPPEATPTVATKTEPIVPDSTPPKSTPTEVTKKPAPTPKSNTVTKTTPVAAKVVEEPKPIAEEKPTTFGDIVIVARPWATVTVDGKPAQCAKGNDRTPCPLKLSTGRHSVVLKNGVDETEKKLNINIKEGKNSNSCWNFASNSSC